jgi:hypothetical protein
MECFGLLFSWSMFTCRVNIVQASALQALVAAKMS